jgi:hypothetical protein
MKLRFAHFSYVVFTPGGKVALLGGVVEFCGGALGTVEFPGARGVAAGVSTGATVVSPGAKGVSPGAAGVASAAAVSPAGGAAVPPEKFSTRLFFSESETVNTMKIGWNLAYGIALKILKN